jgi:hypothetical protein
MKSSQAEERATLAVIRDSPLDTKMRQVIVYLDGKQKTVLSFGESAGFELEPGDHTLKVHNTLVSKSLIFRAEAGKESSFTTGNRAPGCLLAFGATMGAGMMGVFLEERGSP